MPDHRILVTGGCGFVGAHVVRHLSGRGHAVHVLSRRTAPPAHLASALRPGHHHPGDVCDPDRVEQVMRDSQPEIVVHLAAGSHHAPTPEERRASLQLATLGAFNLMQSSVRHGVRHVVVGGSSTVYPFDAPHEPRHERHGVGPTVFRGVAKACEELIFADPSHVAAVGVTVLRLFHVYGPYAPATRWIPTLFRAGERGQGVRMTTDCELGHDFVYVEDVAEAIGLAVDGSPPPAPIRVNIGTGRSTTNATVLQAVRDVTGAPIPVLEEPFPSPPFAPRQWAADTRSAARHLGWTARTDLVEGLRRTHEWFRRDPTPWLTPAHASVGVE